MESGNDIVLAIKENDLSQFALDIININDTISELFVSVDNKMKELKGSFNCSEYDNLMRLYNDFRKNYSVVKHNLSSYSDDLISVVNKVKAGEKDIVFILDEITEMVSNKAKNVEKL